MPDENTRFLNEAIKPSPGSVAFEQALEKYMYQVMHIPTCTVLEVQETRPTMCSDSLTAKDDTAAEKDNEVLTEEEERKLAELEAHIIRGIGQFEAGLGKTFDDKDKFLNYLRNL